jgi:hypothetical protein
MKVCDSLSTILKDEDSLEDLFFKLIQEEELGGTE